MYTNHRSLFLSIPSDLYGVNPSSEFHYFGYLATGVLQCGIYIERELYFDYIFDKNPGCKLTLAILPGILIMHCLWGYFGLGFSGDHNGLTLTGLHPVSFFYSFQPGVYLLKNL